MDKDAIEKLTEMGLNTKVGSFLLYDATWVAFFEWLVTNITPDNIYTDTEMRELLQLTATNSLLSTEQVQERLYDLRQQYPGILSYTDADLKMAEARLENKIKLEEEYRAHYKELQALANEIDEELVEWEERVKVKKEHQKRMLEVCLEEASYVQKQNDTKVTIFEENQHMINEEARMNPPIFLCQMGIRGFQEQSVLFVKHVDSFMTNHFSKTSDGHTNEVVTKMIDDLKQKLVEVDRRSVEVRSDKSSLRDVIRNLPRTKLGEINEREIAPLTDELRNKNAMLQAKYNALETENNILMRTTIQQECDLLLVSRFKAKQMKAVKRLKLLQFIRERVLNAMNNSEMLWILMKIDLEKLSEHMKNAQKYVAGDYTLKKAYHALQIAKKSDVKKLSKQFEVDVLDVQKEFLAQNLFESVNVFETCEEIMKSCQRFKKEIAEAKYLESFSTEFSKMNKLDTLLSDFVLNGATIEPYVKSSDVIQKEMEAKYKQKEISERLERMRNTYDRDYALRWKEDSLWATKQMLWVWFMTDQKKVSLAMQEVKGMAKTTPAFAKFHPNASTAGNH